MSGYLDPVPQMLTLPDIRRSSASFHLSWSIGFVVLGAIFVTATLGAGSASDISCAPGANCAAAAGASRALTLMMIPFGLLVILGLSFGGAFMIRHRMWFNRGADELRRRPTGARVKRVFERTWNSTPEWNDWLYQQFLAGNLAALQQLGLAQWHNLGDLYVNLYVAEGDGIAYLCIGSYSARSRGVDTGWRPIVMTGAWYDYTMQFFQVGRSYVSTAAPGQ